MDPSEPTAARTPSEPDSNAHNLSDQRPAEHYGNPAAEYQFLHESVAILDLSFRGRLCVTGADRQRFVHGQVTNNVSVLKRGEGCYAALVNAKGKMVSDLNIFVLDNEILLDFEPGLTQPVIERLEKYIIADDVQILDISSLYRLTSVQGPKAAQLLDSLKPQLFPDLTLPQTSHQFVQIPTAHWGESYLMRLSRTGTDGFDIFVPAEHHDRLTSLLVDLASSHAGGRAGWNALELRRIEAGIPRFGVDMDSTNLPPETGLESRMISYAKGCYIGQEIIARIRTYGQVAKAFRGLRLSPDLPTLPARGDKLFHEGKEAGYITSAAASPALQANIALGYVRREYNQIGNRLRLHAANGNQSDAEIVSLPFA